MARKELTTINLEKAQMDALRALSKTTGISMAEYVRRGVAWVLEMTDGEGGS